MYVFALDCTSGSLFGNYFKRLDVVDFVNISRVKLCLWSTPKLFNLNDPPLYKIYLFIENVTEN